MLEPHQKDMAETGNPEEILVAVVDKWSILRAVFRYMISLHTVVWYVTRSTSHSIFNTKFGVSRDGPVNENSEANHWLFKYILWSSSPFSVSRLAHFRVFFRYPH